MHRRWSTRLANLRSASHRSGRSARQHTPIAVEGLEDRALLSLTFGLATRAGTATDGIPAIEITDVATDAAGNTYVSGSYFGTVDLEPDINPNPHGEVLPTSQSRDLFIAKYDATGNLIWARAAGGQFDDRATGIDVDNAGNVYAAGFYTGPVNFLGTNLAGGPGSNVFAAKLGTNGNLIWASTSQNANSRNAQAFDVDTDPNGSSVAITGFFNESITFATVGGPTTLTGGSPVAFISRLDGSGNFLYAKRLQSSTGGAFGDRVAIDSGGSVYIAGTFQGSLALDPNGNTRVANSVSDSFDAFILKLGPQGGFAWGKPIGGAGLDQATDIDVDTTGNVYVTGRYDGVVDFNLFGPSVPLNLGVNGISSFFVARYNASDGNNIWARDLGAHTPLMSTAPIDFGGVGIGRPSLTIGPGGQLLAAVTFRGTAQVGGTTLTSVGLDDIAVVQLSSSGTIASAVRAGGPGSDLAWGIAANPNGAIRLAGTYTDSVTFGATTLPDVAPGGSNIFIASLSANSSSNSDFDGDGKADQAVFRPSTAQWIVSFSGPGRALLPSFGAGGLFDIPIPADYDGDGKADQAVFRPSTAQWIVSFSGPGRALLPSFGAGGLFDIPIPADYDGDGKADQAVFRPSTAQWIVSFSGPGRALLPSFGAGGLFDIPIPADYDGDGKADQAVFRPSTAQWIVSFSGPGRALLPSFGAGGLFDIPIPADYDGDGKADQAVFRPSTAQWIASFSGPGRALLPSFGAGGLFDIPVQAPIGSLKALGRVGGVSSSAAALTASLASAPGPIIPLVGLSDAGVNEGSITLFAKKKSTRS